MKKVLLLCLFLLSLNFLSAQDAVRHRYSVAFYNLENLFDTLHDAGKIDHDFLPDGKYRWNGEKYVLKLKNMSRVLGELGRSRVPQGPAFIGVAEVENARVLGDLVRQTPISNYRFVHHEGPDKRGIDCALLYDPRQFTPVNTKLVPSVPYKGDTVHLTRGFLIVDGNMAGDRVCVIVNHWPSRRAPEEVRIHAGRQVKALKDSLLRLDKNMKLFIMGDLNDDPMDLSVRAIGVAKYPNEVKKLKMYNPWWAMLEDRGIGTLQYRGKWNLFDQILVSRSLMEAKSGLRYDGCEVFRPDYLIQQEGRYKGYPLRTFGGKLWLKGYSDHFPTIVYLEK